MELGLYGTIIVEPSDPSYWPPADRHLTVTLDDLLVEDGKVAPFSRSGPTYTAMGRFGNVMLINGELEFSAEAAVGEVVRLYVVNTANTRDLQVGLGAPASSTSAETAVVTNASPSSTPCCSPHPNERSSTCCSRRQAMFAWSTTPLIMSTTSARFSVTGSIEGEAAASFDLLRTDPELSAAREQLDHDLQRPPDKVLAFWSEMPLLYGDDGTKTASETAYHDCPMHPEIAASFAGTCPKCGMTAGSGVSGGPDADAVHLSDARRDRRRMGRVVSALRNDAWCAPMASPRPRTVKASLTATGPATASSGKTTWLRSIARRTPAT